MIGRVLRFLGRLVLALLAALVALWGMLALWYRMPFGEILRYAIPSLWIILAFLAVYGLIIARWRLTLPYIAALAALLVWWQTIEPRSDKDWSPDVARQFTSTIEGSVARISNVRNFDWRSDTDFTEHWEDRSYDLDTLTRVDLYTSTWGSPAIAHTMISFGFADGRALAFSVEVRRQKGEIYSAISGFFKQNELVAIAADERDVIRVRSNVRGEDVQIFSLHPDPARAREAFLYFLSIGNSLAQQPRFYNTATTNCTTVPFYLARQLNPSLPLDWRVLVSGYLPDYLYDIGSLDTSVPLAELRAKGRIVERAKAADQSADFSQAIRVGVPGT
ncbi:membrane protein [Labrys miyagiensis]|uniref:Membrane protein n=1 Tax=Labrys miyagiensis TaxID=346912 RepID=A0ABQ6CFE1_9HYPH|nr:DUF4105 domain-containing protein [Labrys miyagiensis]GLS19082.1 membrane protein [Labrys miyagiensis]